MESYDYMGEDMDAGETRELNRNAGESARDYHAWLAGQDEEIQAEERLFRSNGL